MAKVLALTTARTTKPIKKRRERISMIETPPKPEWLVRARRGGRTVWYLRFVMTGILPRRLGPFKSRHFALLALDAMIDSMIDQILNLNAPCDKYRLDRQFQFNSDAMIEHDFAFAK